MDLQGTSLDLTGGDGRSKHNGPKNVCRTERVSHVYDVVGVLVTYNKDNYVVVTVPSKSVEKNKMNQLIIVKVIKGDDFDESDEDPTN